MVVRVINTYINKQFINVECEASLIVDGTVQSYALPTMQLPRELARDDTAFMQALSTAVREYTERQLDVFRFIGTQFKV